MLRSSLILLFPLLFSILGCSYTLSWIGNPDAPDFSIEAVKEGNNVRITWPADDPTNNIPSDYDKEGKQVSWEMHYAYYVFRSIDSPYNTFNLIGRIYNNNAISATFRDQSTEITNNVCSAVVEYKCFSPQTPPIEGSNVISNLTTYIDTPIDPLRAFYRVAYISLSRSYNEGSSEGECAGISTESHSISEEGVSGWASVGK